MRLCSLASLLIVLFAMVGAGCGDDDYGRDLGTDLGVKVDLASQD